MTDYADFDGVWRASVIDAGRPPTPIASDAGQSRDIRMTLDTACKPAVVTGGRHGLGKAAALRTDNGRLRDTQSLRRPGDMKVVEATY